MVNLKISGVAGIILLVLTIVSFIVSTFMFANSLGGIFGGGQTTFDDLGTQFNKAQKTQTIFSIFISLFTILFVLGFLELGKKYDNKILKIVPWILIGFAILGVIMSAVSLATWDNSKTSISLNPETSGFLGMLEQRFNENPVFAKVFAAVSIGVLIPLIIILVIAALALQILFAMGLMQLDKKGVKLSKASGIMEILTLIPLIGGIIGFVAVLLEVIIFFKESNNQNPSRNQAQLQQMQQNYSQPPSSAQSPPQQSAQQQIPQQYAQQY